MSQHGEEGATAAKFRVDGFMPLVVERIGETQISVCHYGTRNGDRMRGPDMVFIVVEGGEYMPVSWRNDYAGVYQESVRYSEDCEIDAIYQDRTNSLINFAKMWDANIGEQGFVGSEMEVVA